MGTRSTIAVEHDDGTISQVYCHWDGYLSWNGVRLAQYYNTYDRVRELISHGDLSSLGKQIGLAHRRDDTTIDREWCTFYHRDVGEPLRIRQFSDWQQYVDKFTMEQYNYVFRQDGLWYVSRLDSDWEYMPLTLAFLQTG
jgi:hypothetical protein